MPIKKIIQLLYGKKRPHPKNEINRVHAGVRCRSCGGTGILKSYGGKERIVCQMCAATIHVGNYKLEVKGTNHKEVESVSLRLVEEISNEISHNGKLQGEESINNLKGLSDSLRNGEINDSVNNLIQFCKENGYSEFESEALGLSSRFKNLNKSRRKGTLSYEEFVIEQNKIINSIAEILNLINKKIRNA